MYVKFLGDMKVCEKLTYLRNVPFLLEGLLVGLYVGYLMTDTFYTYVN